MNRKDKGEKEIVLFLIPAELIGDVFVLRQIFVHSVLLRFLLFFYNDKLVI